MSTLVCKSSQAPNLKASAEPVKNDSLIPSYKTESVGENYRLTLPSQERKEHPLESFRHQALTTWVPKCNEIDFDAVEWFKHAESCGAIKCKMYTPEELRALDNMDRLLWKEKCHYSENLKRIKMPLNPDHSFAGRYEGPVLFVRDLERENSVIIVNGNHRTGAVMREEYNPAGHPLYVLEFVSIDVYEKLSGSSLSSKLYIGIEVEMGGRRH